MNIIDFLYDNYLWIIAILVIAIFTTIGFIADKKSKSKNGKGNENISTPNNQAKVVPTEVPTPVNNINTNMNMAGMLNNNYQNVNNNMVNNVPNFATNNMQQPVNNMNEQSMINNYTNGGVVSPTNQVPNIEMNKNMMPNSNQTMNGVNQSMPNVNSVPTPEPVVNPVNQMMPNENIQQGFVNPMSTSNQNVNQVSNGTFNVNPVPEQTPVYNNQAMGNGNPNMVVNSWDEPRPISPVNINQGFNQNNISNIPTNSSSSQIPIQESIPVNTVPNNIQQPVNNMPNVNGAPGLNFVYGPSQNNNNNNLQ